MLCCHVPNSCVARYACHLLTLCCHASNLCVAMCISCFDITLSCLQPKCRGADQPSRRQTTREPVWHARGSTGPAIIITRCIRAQLNHLTLRYLPRQDSALQHPAPPRQKVLGPSRWLSISPKITLLRPRINEGSNWRHVYKTLVRSTASTNLAVCTDPPLRTFAPLTTGEYLAERLLVLGP